VIEVLAANPVKVRRRFGVAQLPPELSRYAFANEVQEFLHPLALPFFRLGVVGLRIP